MGDPRAVAGALAAAQRAFARPTLALLNKQSAPLVVAVFDTVFTRGRGAVAAEQMHLEVHTLLAELAAAGVDVPAEPARVLCARWVRERWLISDVNDADVEEYRLTSHAQEALELVKRTGGARSLVSESRIRALLDTVDRAAQDATGDRAERLASIDAQLAALTAERDRLASGADLEPAPADRMVEAYDHVQLLVRELPADFARVAESIKELQRQIIAQLRADERPTGEILAEYLEASENLMVNTPEGRAFTGAMELLTDAELLAALDDHVAAILRHPFARSLSRAEREGFRGIRAQIVSALDVVQSEQARASRTLTAQVRGHNPLRDRELDHAIRDVVSALAQWFPESSRGARVAPLRWFGRAQLGRLRDSLHDLRPETPPAALETWADDDERGDLDEIRALGGPQHAWLAAHVAELRAGGAGDLSVAEAFASAPAELRRPVEILGFLELADADVPDQSHGDLPGAVERVVARRADGSEREFALPRVLLAPPTHRGEPAPAEPEGAA